MAKYCLDDLRYFATVNLTISEADFSAISAMAVQGLPGQIGDGLHAYNKCRCVMSYERTICVDVQGIRVKAKRQQQYALTLVNSYNQ